MSHGLRCLDKADDNNDCKVTVTFEDTGTLQLKWVRVQQNKDGTTYLPTDFNATQLERRLVNIFPIASNDLDATRGLLDYGSGTLDFDLLLANLHIMKFFDGCWTWADLSGCQRLYYGIVVGPTEEGIGGLGERPGVVSAGKFGNGARYNTHAHEIGHNLGRYHAVDSTLGTHFSEYYNDSAYQGYCGEEALLSAPDFPYFAIDLGDMVATIGPMDQGVNRLIHGMRTNTLDFNQVGIWTPFSAFELMSYCGDSIRWISDYTYEAVHDRINELFPPPPKKFFLESAIYLVIAGIMELDTGATRFLPFHTVESRLEPPQMPEGPFTLLLLDRRNQVINRVPFQPNIHAGQAVGPVGEPPIRTGNFVIPVPFDERMVRAEVRDETGRTLVSVDRSANPPQVEVVSPNRGERLRGREATFSWTGRDADGDPLSYLVQVSTDCGETYDTLAVDLRNTTLTVPVEVIGGTDCGLLRVSASDGFNSTQDVSDAPFTIPNQAPHVTIVRPQDDATAPGGELFEGSAFDPEDGALRGESLEWRSDRDGRLGTGEVLFTLLSAGRHRITLTARDSDGTVARDVVTFVVEVADLVTGQPPQPPQPPQTQAPTTAPRRGRSFHLGYFPPGAFATVALDVERPLTDNLSIVGLVGYHPALSTSIIGSYTNASVNVRIYSSTSRWRWFLQGGPGVVYLVDPGPTSPMPMPSAPIFGLNVGAGIDLAIGSRLSLELSINVHPAPDPTLGVKFRF
ncbi:MAG: hypothetical protein ACE5JP_00725 [Candidatus Bipolaricaulia bacterium]